MDNLLLFQHVKFNTFPFHKVYKPQFHPFHQPKFDHFSNFIMKVLIVLVVLVALVALVAAVEDEERAAPQAPMSNICYNQFQYYCCLPQPVVKRAPYNYCSDIRRRFGCYCAPTVADV